MDKTYTNGSDRTEEHILVCLSSSPSNKKIVHTAAAMAAAGAWKKIYMQNKPAPFRFMFKTEYYRIHLIKKGLKNIFILLKNSVQKL